MLTKNAVVRCHHSGVRAGLMTVAEGCPSLASVVHQPVQHVPGGAFTEAVKAPPGFPVLRTVERLLLEPIPGACQSWSPDPVPPRMHQRARRLRGADPVESPPVELDPAHPKPGGGLLRSERGIGGDQVRQILAPADLRDLAGVVQRSVQVRAQVVCVASRRSAMP